MDLVSETERVERPSQSRSLWHEEGHEVEGHDQGTGAN